MRILFILVMILTLPSCGLVRSLRSDAYNDAPDNYSERPSYSKKNYGKLPPPATVMDRQLNQFAGEPVDLSGVRAKAGNVNKKDLEMVAARNDNSLWKEDGQSNYFFAANQAKLPGDLITVDVGDDLRADFIKEIKNTLSDEDLELGVDVKGLGYVGNYSKPGGADSAQSSAVKKPEETKTEDGSTTPPATGEEKPKDVAAADASGQKPISYTAEVVKVFPNGNIMIRGVKSFVVGNKTRRIEITSITRAADINEKGTVKSESFFEHKAEIYR